MTWHNERRRHSLAARGIKTAVDNPREKAMMRVKPVVKPTPEAEFNKETLSEQEVKLLKRRLNDGKISFQDLNKIKYYYEGEGFGLTDSQNKKGKDFLLDQWKTPTGKERTNNPFGFRETSVLENFKEIRLVDFYNTSRAGQMNYYLPVYSVESDDSAFEYYYDGKINIIG